MQHFTTHLWSSVLANLTCNGTDGTTNRSRWHRLSRIGSQRIAGHAGAQCVFGFKPRSSVPTVKLGTTVLVHPVTPTSTAYLVKLGPRVYPVKPGSTAYPFRSGSTLYSFEPGSTAYPFRPESTLYPFKPGSTAYPIRPG